MSVDVQEEQQQTVSDQNEAEAPRRAPLLARMAEGLRNVEWRVTLITALIMAIGWCALFLAPSILQILAGIVPVMAGLYLGRRVKGNYLSHGLMLGISGFLMGLIFVLAYGLLADTGVLPLPELAVEANQPPRPISTDELIFFYVSFSLFAMIPFPAFGTVMSGRAETRNRELKRFVEERGGRLERPSAVRTLEDLQGLSLPQLGTYVSNLFKKQGFDFIDYRFIDKDKHLDLEFSYEGETYLLRLSVADKVRPGTIESLTQEMKRRKLPKGLAITNTEFTPDALKSARNRRNIVAIDGATLYEIAEN